MKPKEGLDIFFSAQKNLLPKLQITWLLAVEMKRHHTVIWERVRRGEEKAAVLFLQIGTLFQSLLFKRLHPSKSDALRSFDDYFGAKCVLLQVLHEIARVRCRGLSHFWVNTSSELFGCWSPGAIRPLSVNPTS